MTTAKKNTAAKAATEKAAETKAAPAPVEQPAQQPVEQPAPVEQKPTPAPVEKPVEPDNDGKVEVICLREFDDLDEDTRRHIGDRFRVTTERAADILAKFKPELIAVIGGGDE